MPFQININDPQGPKVIDMLGVHLAERMTQASLELSSWDMGWPQLARWRKLWLASCSIHWHYLRKTILLYYYCLPFGDLFHSQPCGLNGMDLLVQRKAFICLSQPANHIFGLGLTFLLHRLTAYPTCPNSITPSKWNTRRHVLVSMKVNLLPSQEWAGNKGTLWSLGWMCITEVRTELSERKRRRAEQRQEKLCPWWH